ncbi:MAG: metallophosphoesterase, partial [Muribaculaceae bacterium]|nr:metallophosphoesterase [Muribaculaceae bacterium]
MIYFLSDLHLGAAYLPGNKTELRVVRFLEQISADATELYLLGDILDYWYEYRNVVPRGFVRFFGALARLADSGVKITWLTGNHDIWQFADIRNEIGSEIIDGA